MQIPISHRFLTRVLIQPRTTLAHEQSAKILLYTVKLLYRPFSFTLSIPETRGRVKYDKATSGEVRKITRRGKIESNRFDRADGACCAATKKPLLLSFPLRFHTYFSFFYFSPLHFLLKKTRSAFEHQITGIR